MPEIIRGLEFEDTDQLAHGVGWDIDFRQLDAGRFRGSADLTVTPTVTVMRISLGRSFHQRGRALPGTRTYGLVDLDAPDIRWHGVAAEGGLLDFNSPDGFDAVSAEQLKGYTFSIDEGLLSRTASELRVDGPENHVSSTRLWHDGATGQLARLRRHLQCLDTAYGNASDPRADRELEQLLAEQVLMLMQLDPATPVPGEWRRHRRVLDRALTFTEDNIEDTVTVADICKGIGVSYSTLQRIFHKELGQTPKRYIRTLRLQRVRNELLSGGGEVVIADVANRWGFWHLGQFARDYRRQFHELPRETIRRRPARTAGNDP
jgi:AraC-like DNA-binding protein